jgi:hypothetical protein
VAKGHPQPMGVALGVARSHPQWPGVACGHPQWPGHPSSFLFFFLFLFKRNKFIYLFFNKFIFFYSDGHVSIFYWV